MQFDVLIVMQDYQKSIYKSVLQVGEQHVNFRGGIGAVLATYKLYFPFFKSVGSHCHASSLGKVLYFIGNYFVLIWLLLWDHSIRIVQIHGSYGASVYRKAIIAFTAKSVFNKKIIYHIHSSEYIQKFKAGGWLYKQLCLFLLTKSDAVACLTPKWKELFIEEFGLKNVVVMRNMISLPDFQLVNKTERKPGYKLNLVFLGLIDEKKGVFDLVTMANEYQQQLNGKVVINVGGIGKSTALKSSISNYRVEHIVSYRGWIGEQEKMALLKVADVFILPSYNEGLPVSILEAMSYGLPIIASRVGGIPEIIKDQVNGFLVEKGDRKGFLEAIQKYSTNSQLLLEHSKQSTELVKQFSPQTVLPQIEAIYSGLLNRFVSTATA